MHLHLDIVCVYREEETEVPLLCAQEALRSRALEGLGALVGAVVPMLDLAASGE